MPHNLRNAGISASGVALGCHSTCARRQRPEPVGPISIIRAAVESGVTLIDCCPTGGPAVESIIAKAIGLRKAPVLLSVRSASSDVRRECENSLRRLGVDQIDLYYVRPTPGKPIEQIMAAAVQLVRAGKIAHIGLSGVTADLLRQAQAIHPISALVTEYSLLARPEDGLLATARELNLAVLACRPLAGGWLTGRPPTAARVSYQDQLRLRAAERAAAELDLGLSRLALAWLMAQDDVIPIPGTCDQVHLEMNLASAAVRLPPESLAQLSEPIRPAAAKAIRIADEPAEGSATR